LQGADPGTTSWRQFQGGKDEEVSGCTDAVWRWSRCWRLLPLHKKLEQRADPGTPDYSRLRRALVWASRLSEERLVRAGLQPRLRRHGAQSGAGGAIRAAMILGLVFVETLSLLTFVIAIVLYLKM